MRPRHSLALLVAAVLGSNANPSLAVDGHGGDNRWLFPGEYESHQAMWMFWPTFEYKAGFPSTEPMGEMIQAMRGHTHVNLGVQDAADEADARSLLSSSGVPLDHVHFFHIPHGDIWARDMGPQFTRRAGRLRIGSFPTAASRVRAVAGDSSPRWTASCMSDSACERRSVGASSSCCGGTT